MQKRIADYGIRIGRLDKGPLNKISDVAGVRVGHATIATERNQTGVSVILPSTANPFSHKLPAAAYVLNGYGKSLGLVQVEELGSLETPIFLTNTLNVGRVHDAAVDYMIETCAQEGIELLSVNPLVGECNDAYLNDIQHRVVGAEHVRQAIQEARADFEEGAVGAGRGMSCHQLKGGIGSASRVFGLDGQMYTLGCLVLSNHGSLPDLTIAGDQIGPRIQAAQNAAAAPDQGSIIVVLASDAPLSDRQLKRMLKRAAVGLARVGSYIGQSSGDIFLGFSTAYSLSSPGDILPVRIVNETRLDLLFRAAAECVEEAVLNSMVCAASTTGYRGHRRISLSEYLSCESSQ